MLELPWTQRCIITEQLLHEAEYDMKSYADRGGYPSKPKEINFPI